MRQLKFRVWDNRDKEFVYFDDLYWFEENQVHSPADQLNDDPWIIQQFTGIKDCDGTEIYEGDLVDLEVAIGLKEWETLRNQEVIYIEDRGMFSFGRDEWSMCDYIRRETIKVVGNIYE